MASAIKKKRIDPVLQSNYRLFPFLTADDIIDLTLVGASNPIVKSCLKLVLLVSTWPFAFVPIHKKFVIYTRNASLFVIDKDDGLRHGGCYGKTLDRRTKDKVLFLIPEEAVYLSFVMNSALIYCSETQRTLSNKSFWLQISEKDPTFVPRFLVFHYFSVQGWNVKSGVKYGVDYGILNFMK